MSNVEAKIGSQIRIRLPNDYQAQCDPAAPFDGNPLTLVDITRRSQNLYKTAMEAETLRILSPMFFRLPKLTRWQRFKRRVEHRVDCVRDAWAVLIGRKTAREDWD